MHRGRTFIFSLGPPRCYTTWLIVNASLNFSRARRNLFCILTPFKYLRSCWTASAFAGFLPLPALFMLPGRDTAQVACAYLGLALAWLATEIFRCDGLPVTYAAWRAKMLALWIAVLANVALFIGLGLSVGTRSNLPFPLMAALSATPALGLAPWLSLRVRQQYAALILGAMIVGSLKLVGCIVARLVYGPQFDELGYIAGDWRTAKLMISTFWGLTACVSMSLLVADWWKFKRQSIREANTQPLCREHVNAELS